MSRPTAGSWQIEETTLSISAPHPKPDRNRLAVAYVSHERIEREVNARLIAAAPVLLEMLKQFLKEAVSYHDNCGHGEFGAAAQCDSICELIPTARAIIATIEGKS